MDRYESMELGTLSTTLSEALGINGSSTYVSGGGGGGNEFLDIFIDLPQYQTSGTTDKAIYDAVVALGWDSDVLVN